jgi:hypothetical protein
VGRGVRVGPAVAVGVDVAVAGAGVFVDAGTTVGVAAGGLAVRATESTGRPALEEQLTNAMNSEKKTNREGFCRRPRSCG